MKAEKSGTWALQDREKAGLAHKQKAWSTCVHGTVMALTGFESEQSGNSECEEWGFCT